MNMNRGRPLGSKVRQNIIEILYFFRRLHGYEIFRVYKELFPPVTLRLIYYHLKKGIDTGELRVYKIAQKEAQYSWGQGAENIIYELGPAAKPIVEPRIKLYLEKHNIEKHNK